MTIASGAFKELRIKQETTYGTFAGASSAQELPRVSCTLDLAKESYKPASIRTDQQSTSARQGTRKVSGTLKGELAPGHFKIPMEATLRRVFGTGATSGAIATVSITSTGFHDSGSGFLTAGFKVGMVVKATGFVSPADVYNGNRYVIATATASDLTLLHMTGVAATFTTHVAGDTVTVQTVGKTNYVPATGHTNFGYSIEQWFSDVAQSEAFLGCKFGSMDVNLQPNAFATVDFEVMGQDILTSTSQQFTTPTAVPSSTGLTATNGALLVQGAAVGLLTGLQFKTDGNMSTGAVIGSALTPDVFPGRLEGSGQLTAYFQDATLRDYFINETHVSIVAVMTTANTDTAEFISFVLPLCTLNGATKDDKETGGIILTAPFTFARSEAAAATSTIDTTVMVQDSTL